MLASVSQPVFDTEFSLLIGGGERASDRKQMEKAFFFLLKFLLNFSWEFIKDFY